MLFNVIKILITIFLIGTASKAGASFNQIANKDTYACVNPIESVLVFISLNMPDKFLQKLSQEAQNSKIPSYLLLKKLYKNSLKETQDRIQRLGIKVIIHPELFEENITQSIPTFIFNKKSGLLVLHGNLSLDSATEQAVDNLGHKY